MREAVQALEAAETPEAVLAALRHGFSGSEFSHLELWMAPELGEAFADVDAVGRTLHGYEVTFPLVAVGVGPEPGHIGVRLTLTTSEGRDLATIGLQHGRWSNRFPTEFRAVVEEVLPSLRAAFERVLLLSSPAPDDRLIRRERRDGVEGAGGE
jgi:hypothetical protein